MTIYSAKVHFVACNGHGSVNLDRSNFEGRDEIVQLFRLGEN